MSNKEILEKVLNKAKLNGYNEVPDYESILFSRNFAQAFFGNEDRIYSQNAWIHRLKEMSQTNNIFEYLKKFI